MLIDLLRAHAREAPDRTFIATLEKTISYAQALERAEALARGLAARSIDRFGCVLTDRADVILLLCAASAVGSEACVYLSTLDEADVESIAASFDHRVLVTDRSFPGSDRETLTAEDLLTYDDTELRTPQSAPVLILTTGTTGAPKGARHDWGRLVAAQNAGPEAAEERWLLVYNLNQFGGMQVMLRVLAGGSTLITANSPQPRAALEVMRAFGVTHASATPTFWRFVVGLLDEAAAAEMQLKQVTMGGEAVPARLLDDLRRLFPDAHISQVYASTEAGSIVSVRDGRSGLPLSVLDRGDDAPVRLRIVDGELQTKSRVGMVGYAGQSDETAEWRGTGDLVEIVGDRIQFVGRASEIINVGGVKVHPLKVEEIVGGLGEVEMARVYGRSNPMTGQIVAVDVVARPGVDPDELKDKIREACSELPPPAQPRRIKLVDALDVRDNKIVRRPDDVPQETS